MVIPDKWKKKLLVELHKDHPGICNCKKLYVVAGAGRFISKKLCRLSSSQECTTSCPITTLGMAVAGV